jgi:acyl carrier protein
MVQVEDILALFEGDEIDVDPSTLKPSVPLVLQGLDSMDIATLIFQVERRFGVTVVAEDSYRLRSLTDFVDLLNATDGEVARPIVD